jgi:hypothetical protein
MKIYQLLKQVGHTVIAGHFTYTAYLLPSLILNVNNDFLNIINRLTIYGGTLCFLGGRNHNFELNYEQLRYTNWESKLFQTTVNSSIILSLQALHVKITRGLSDHIQPF